jgi:hypothetical protein
MRHYQVVFVPQDIHLWHGNNGRENKSYNNLTKKRPMHFSAILDGLFQTADTPRVYVSRFEMHI